MAEKKKNVFEKLQESLDTVAEEIHMANDALYVVATELIDTTEKIDALNAKLDKIFSNPINVIISGNTNDKTDNQKEMTATKYVLTGKQHTVKEI